MNRRTLSLITLANGQMPDGLYHLQQASCKSKLVSGDAYTAVCLVCVCVSEGVRKKEALEQFTRTAGT